MTLNGLLKHCPTRLVASVIVLVIVASVANGQGPVPRARAQVTTRTTSPVVGKWTYRSFLSDPDLNAEPNSLLFGSGTMELAVTEPDSLAGTLGGESWLRPARTVRCPGDLGRLATGPNS